jgi:hypothetical protein
MADVTSVESPVRTTRGRVPAAIAGLVLAGLAVASRAPAFAGDVYDLARKDVWQVGDVVTSSVVEKDYQSLKFVEADGTALGKPPSEVTVTAKFIERCAAVDSAGNRTRTFVYIVSWSAEDGTTTDTSLTAAVLDVTGTGKDRVAKVASSREELTKSASAWLGRRYGGGRPEPASARGYWLPKAPVAVGDTWSADLSTFLDATAAGTRLDRSLTKSTCTLTSVEKSVAHVTCEGTLVLASFPGKEAGKPIPWKSGGTQFVKGTVTVGLEGRIVPGTLALAATLSGEAELGGKSVALVMKKDHRIDVVVGGEWPASVPVPATEAPAAPTAPADGPAMGAMGG